MEDFRFLLGRYSMPESQIPRAPIYEEDDEAQFSEVETTSERLGSMLGNSQVMGKLFREARRVAESSAPVLITGPTGSGKKLLAQQLHRQSTRKMQNFVHIGVRSYPVEVLEQELFGTPARGPGKLSLAQVGTLFLEEINELPLSTQQKLLTSIKNREVGPRIVAASPRNLEELVELKLFNEDLYFQLSVVTLKIPSLKERRDDIPILFQHFLKKQGHSEKMHIHPRALKSMLDYAWPGNVRELQNVIERLVILSGEESFVRLVPEMLPEKILMYNYSRPEGQYHQELPEAGLDLKEVMQEIENSLIHQALIRTQGNKNQAARLLRMNRTTLIEKLKKTARA